MNENVKVDGTKDAAALNAENKAMTPKAKGGKSRRMISRITLMAVVPLALVIGGGWYWINGGRYLSTENAYVNQDAVSISSQISGVVKQVMVRQDQHVIPGEVLFTIDDATYRIAVEKAESAVASARLEVGQLRAAWSSAKVKVDSARETLDYDETTLKRQQKLTTNGINTQSALDKSLHDVNQARQSLAEAQQNLATTRAALDGNPEIETDKHPIVLSALAALDQAKLDLAHAVVKAPVAGVMAEMSSLQAGGYVTPGTAVAAIVETGKSWVEANYNETDLEHIKPGDPATLTLDAYPDMPLKAEVQSIGAGTGATFSLLPAQNATGNWVKVVQRVPVRLKILGTDNKVALRAGLSVSTTIDTGYVRALPFLSFGREATAHEQH